MAGGTALLGLQFLLQLVLGLREKGVSENNLTLWLREHDLKFNEWLSDLRIEEAKRIIRQCPDWTNETIADACGFTDRIAFQKKFKQKTGLTPTEWLERGKRRSVLSSNSFYGKITGKLNAKTFFKTKEVTDNQSLPLFQRLCALSG